MPRETRITYYDGSLVINLNQMQEDINYPKWDKAKRVHDWRNYVPNEFKKAWKTLGAGTRDAIYIMASKQAQDEEWE